METDESILILSTAQRKLVEVLQDNADLRCENDQLKATVQKQQEIIDRLIQDHQRQP